MSISVGDAVLKITGDTSGVDKSLAGVKGKLEQLSPVLKKVGLGMMATGTAMVAGFVAATKAANDEQVGIRRLTQQLQNAGVEYDNVKESLEGVISATQRKTGIADDEQRRALGDLLVTTGDYNKALNLLPLALDLAAAKEMDVSAAAELVGKVAEGNISILARYGIQMKEGATAAEALAALQQKVGGTAAAAADPMKILGATFDDLSETIGGALLGDMNNFIGKATEIIEKVTTWVKENPELVRTLAMVGVALIGAGGLLYAVTLVSNAITAISTAYKAAALAAVLFNAASNPAYLLALVAALSGLGVGLGLGTLFDNLKSGKGILPSFQGFEGTIPGIPGTPIPAIVHAGEYIGQGASGGDIIFNVSGVSIREEADIERLAQRFYRMYQSELRLKGA